MANFLYDLFGIGKSPWLLQKVDFIILEMPFFGKYNENIPNFLEYIVFMDSIGFIPYDLYKLKIGSYIYPLLKKSTFRKSGAKYHFL